MEPDVLTVPRKEPQVFKPVVGLVPVDVVDDLIVREVPAEVFLHHKPVFANLVLDSLRMIRGPHMNIPLVIDMSAAVPSRVSRPFVASSLHGTSIDRTVA